MIKIKIIQSYKFKEHMEAHQNDFIKPYNKLIQWTSRNRKFEILEKDFEEIIIDYPFNVGYNNLVKVDPEDQIVYAKRRKRQIYTKFVKNRRPVKTNSVVMILKKNGRKNNEFYVITMFPGRTTIKEPQDPHIKSDMELEKSLCFWREHALIYNRDIIDVDTETTVCPYIDLYHQHIKRKKVS